MEDVDQDAIPDAVVSLNGQRVGVNGYDIKRSRWDGMKPYFEERATAY
jgi:hypothetical protein